MIKNNRFLATIWAAATWTVIIAVLCGFPGNRMPSLNFYDLFSLDGAAHAFVFAVFTFLWATWFFLGGRRFILGIRFPEFSFLLACFYGMFIEILQYFLFYMRSAEWSDLIADIIGAGLGIFFFFRIFHYPVAKE